MLTRKTFLELLALSIAAPVAAARPVFMDERQAALLPKSPHGGVAKSQWRPFEIADTVEIWKGATAVVTLFPPPMPPVWLLRSLTFDLGGNPIEVPADAKLKLGVDGLQYLNGALAPLVGMRTIPVLPAITCMKKFDLELFLPGPCKLTVMVYGSVRVG